MLRIICVVINAVVRRHPPILNGQIIPRKMYGVQFRNVQTHQGQISVEQQRHTERGNLLRDAICCGVHRNR